MTSKFIHASAFLSLLLLFNFFLSSDYYCCLRVARCRSDSDKLPVSRVLQKISRKMLEEMKKEMKDGVDGGERRWLPVGWEELRRVPSGPDPLHHNGGSPKKPRTP